MESPDLCFVYGTLRRGFGNHWVMRRAGGQFVGEATSQTPFPLVIDGLPYLLDHPGEGLRVEGELYRIPDRGWKILDRLEGHPDFYRRRVERFVINESIIEAWAYFLARESAHLRGLPPVASFAKTSEV